MHMYAYMYASMSSWGSINLDGRKLDEKGVAPPIAKIVVSRRKKDLKMFQNNFPHGSQSETAKTSK